MCPEWAPYSGAPYIGSKSFARLSSFWRHFQGAFLRGGYPRDLGDGALVPLRCLCCLLFKLLLFVIFRLQEGR